MSKRAQQKYTSPIPKQRNGSAAASAITTLQRSAMTTESQIIAAAHHTAQSEKLPKDIDFDVTWLERISQRLQQEGDDQFVSWLQTFTLFCQKLAQRDEETQAAAQRIQQLELTLEEQSEKLEQDRVEHDIQARELAEKKAGIVSKERELNERELNAKAGFSEQNAASLRNLTQRQQLLDQQHQEDIQQLITQKQGLMREISQAIVQLTQLQIQQSDAEAQRSLSLDQREEDIIRKEEDLKRASRRLERDERSVEAERQALNECLAEAMQTERLEFEKKLDQKERQFDKAQERVQNLSERLMEWEELDQALNGQSASQMLNELDKLRDENRELKSQFAHTNLAELERENKSLANSKSALKNQLENLLAEMDKLQREVDLQRVAATQLETVAREKRLLEQQKHLLGHQIDEIEARIGKLTDASKTQTPFPAMSQMDEKNGLNAKRDHREVGDLKNFASELQQRIAQAEESVQLFYPLESIQLLLGGLAMSQLHLFHGISGTGKTSLAKAFAKAMGGFCTDISVQAGWRDRDDLLGHYNAFERRYYEKDCLQALYRAQTPYWQDTCNVILLDEMNLSRPEQYFAEFLSALEKNSHADRKIALTETALLNAPERLVEGRHILVPGNLWFIGTANHDETTNELADKTYDRAHVMTLPKHDTRFPVREMEKTSYSWRSLHEAFAKAKTQHAETVRNMLEQLSGHEFTHLLETDFGIGWGNRFDKQAMDFIPVTMASGAEAGRALDHLLATRIMRSGKVTGRYNIGLESVTRLKEELEFFWIQVGLQGDPVESMALLEADIRRLSGAR